MVVIALSCCFHSSLDHPKEVARCRAIGTIGLKPERHEHVPLMMILVVY